MKSISNKHHYIPIFFTKGFSDDNENIYVYDKTKDFIHYKKKSPSSVFFEMGRNTGKIHEKQFDEVETVQFGILDNLASKFIEEIRQHINPVELLNSYKIVQLKWFASNFYWRLPVNDEIFDSMYPYLNINPKAIVGDTGIPIDELLKIDLFKKVVRSNMPFSTFEIDKVNEMEIVADIIKLPIKYLLLSDNPIVYKKVPGLQSNIHQELIFAISADVLFVLTEKGKYNEINADIINYLNLLIIHQAQKYVVSHSFETLTSFVNVYRECIREKEILCSERLFSLVNGYK